MYGLGVQSFLPPYIWIGGCLTDSIVYLDWLQLSKVFLQPEKRQEQAAAESVRDWSWDFQYAKHVLHDGSLIPQDKATYSRILCISTQKLILLCSMGLTPRCVLDCSLHIPLVHLAQYCLQGLIVDGAGVSHRGFWQQSLGVDSLCHQFPNEGIFEWSLLDGSTTLMMVRPCSGTLQSGTCSKILCMSIQK